MVFQIFRDLKKYNHPFFGGLGMLFIFHVRAWGASLGIVKIGGVALYCVLFVPCCCRICLCMSILCCFESVPLFLFWRCKGRNNFWIVQEKGWFSSDFFKYTLYNIARMRMCSLFFPIFFVLWDLVLWCFIHIFVLLLTNYWFL